MRRYPLVATVTVTNVGTVPGATPVLAFVQDPAGVTAGRVVRPWKRLVGFARTPVLAPGAHILLSVAVRDDDLSFLDSSYVLALQSGVYTLSLGLSSLDDAEHTVNFTI